VESGSLGGAGEERGVAGPQIAEDGEIARVRRVEDQDGRAGAARGVPVEARAVDSRVGTPRGDAESRTLSIHFGCLVAFMAAISANLGKVCQKRGTQDLPLLQFKGNVLRTYLGSPWWVAGLGLDVGGALMTLVALALAPVSVVQPILGCGLAFVAIFSHYLTSDHLRTFDWGACLVCVLGTIGVGVSSEEGSGHEEMFLLVGVLLLGFFFLVVVASEVMARSRMLHLEAASSISAGVCFGLSACSTRFANP
jgi:drug/metabolite transporter (DMT)-like permease